MKTPFIKSKKGFTIIEVSLVLAIGGLIMLMVFIAWPAVQRNQRDSQRKTTDVPYLVSQIVNYTSNNKGSLPKASPADTTLAVVSWDEDSGQPVDTKSAGSWLNFYKNYLLINGTSFADPSSGGYGLTVIPCGNAGATLTKPNADLNRDAECNNTTNMSEVVSGANSVNILSNGTLNIPYADQGGYITIVVGAYCDGSVAKAATSKTGGTRNYAVMYALESGGVYCQGS